ncbi:MAG: carbon-nitrogen hydrolase family protein, partial [Ktedonobacterales bacterium]
TVALVQMRSEKGAIAANLDATADYLRQAVERSVDVIAFPEASLTGYVDPTRYPDAVVRLDGPEVARLLALTQRMELTVIAGLVEANPAGAPYLTQIVARAGRPLGVYRKRTIPPDEAHLFASGMGTTPIFSHQDVPFGLAICADIERPAVFAGAAAAGARLVFECAAPGLYGAQETRDWQSGHAWWRGECHEKLAAYARANGITIAVATAAGRTRDEDFPGGGYVFTPDGACLAESDGWAEGMLVVTLDDMR